MPKKYNFPDSVIQRMRDRRDLGESFETIAQSYGVSHRTIRNVLGVPPGSGRLDRAASGRPHIDSRVRIAIDQHEWLTQEADRVNCTMATLIEIAVQHFRITMVRAGVSISRENIVDFLEERKLTP